MSELRSFVCPYCQARNERPTAGEDRCEKCGALVLTQLPAFDGDDLRVVISSLGAKGES
ncbi:hypothetical protein BH20VER3_BH20VER3_00850 [soil metagenome]